jgi:hypothetical protein
MKRQKYNRFHLSFQVLLQAISKWRRYAPLILYDWQNSLTLSATVLWRIKFTSNSCSDSLGGVGKF